MDRRETWTAVIVFVYNLAVALSGFYAAQAIGETDRVVMFLVGSGLAVVWTIYFMFAMRKRLSRGFLEEDAEEAEAEADPRSS